MESGGKIFRLAATGVLVAGSTVLHAQGPVESRAMVGGYAAMEIARWSDDGSQWSTLHGVGLGLEASVRVLPRVHLRVSSRSAVMANAGSETYTTQWGGGGVRIFAAPWSSRWRPFLDGALGIRRGYAPRPASEIGPMLTARRLGGVIGGGTQIALTPQLSVLVSNEVVLGSLSRWRSRGLSAADAQRAAGVLRSSYSLRLGFGYQR